MISIIIPTLNEEKFIGKTIKQFLPYKKKYNLEIIISDGGSSDNTTKIAKKYADKLVNCVNCKTIAANRNNGARYAMGNILFHTDADVRLPKINGFFNQVIRTFKDEDIVGVTSLFRIYPTQETIFDKLFHQWLYICIKFSWIIGIPIARGKCNIVRKKTFDHIGGYRNLIVGEDHDLFGRLKKFGKIKLLNYYLTYSPRRYRRWGYLKSTYIYVRETIFFLIGLKSKMRRW